MFLSKGNIMRDKTRLVFVLSASVMALSIGGSSLAQSHRVVEPIPQYKTLDSLPIEYTEAGVINCLLYTSPSPRDLSTSRMPSSA